MEIFNSEKTYIWNLNLLLKVPFLSNAIDRSLARSICPSYVFALAYTNVCHRDSCNRFERLRSLSISLTLLRASRPSLATASWYAHHTTPRERACAISRVALYPSTCFSSRLQSRACSLLDHRVNRQLLENITPRVLAWSNRQLLGDVFLQITNFLEGYTEYVKEYARIIKHMPEIRENRETRAIIEVCPRSFYALPYIRCISSSANRLLLLIDCAHSLLAIGI